MPISITFASNGLLSLKQAKLHKGRNVFLIFGLFNEG